jgi:hypothetical protein
MNQLPPCASCVQKFVAANGRKPHKNETEQMNRAKPGCDCAPCDIEDAYRSAGLRVPPDYPTFDESYKLLFAR